MAEQTFPLQEKLKKAMITDPRGIHELNKHLIEALTAKDPGMVALGYDCLQEVLGLLTIDQRTLILDSWNEYFDTSSEFKDLMDNHKPSKRLLEIYKNKVQPLKMKPKPIDKSKQPDLRSYIESKEV